MISDHPEYSNHELIQYCRDAEARLTGIIALHDTSAGPAMGGCRMAPYRSETEALTDVLRLSKGMSLLTMRIRRRALLRTRSHVSGSDIELFAQRGKSAQRQLLSGRQDRIAPVESRPQVAMSGQPAR